MKRLLLTITIFACSNAMAFDNQRWLDCSNINNNDDRLACYDRVAKSIQSRETIRSDNAVSSSDDVPEQPLVISSSSAEATQLISEPIIPVKIEKQEEQISAAEIEAGFGLEHKKTQQEEDTESVSFTIEKAKKSIHGKWTLWFDNGQKWQTISSEKLKFKAGQDVKISRGVFNSFVLNVEGSNRTVKVKRTK
ncbi:hypothetical protein E2K93_07010 [Thalassotalea sp. HSM 43]|uniref:hypothetical protein n=1 Tax=Thalassotalea sp. HSM 43 TaxID=2552945 RepID=UPI0010815736|nr:hypothetical protein [Thalassotalea sp. HSM 43]QBY04150.1 hypothetical protein E2K93_07010 [Thalassotalea sp. HSM 43]